MKTRKVTVLVATLLCTALLFGACGSGRSGSQGAGDDTSQTTAPADDVAGTFGDLTDVCGPGAPSGATDQGVTPDSVTIGYGDDAGYTGAPGSNHETSLSVEAMIKWCNEAGGIHGRTVKGNYYDAAIFNTNNVMTEACSQVFMMVGTAWALDGSGEQTRVNCGMPAVNTWAVEGDVSNGPLMFQPNPAPVDVFNNAGFLSVGKAFPDEVTKAAIIYIDFATGIEQRDKTLAAASTNGWEFLGCDVAYPVSGVPDFKPYVQKVKDCGAEAVYFIGGDDAFRSVWEAAAQLEYRPLVVGDGGKYGTDLATWNKDGYLGSNFYVQTNYVPFEQASSNPAVAQYLDLIGGQGIRTTQLSETAVSAFLLWASQANKCGADLTRDCVVNNLRGVNSWTGGGLHTPSDPGQNEPGACALTLHLDGSTWEQWDPKEQGVFSCNPDNFVTVDTPGVAAAQLGPDRVSQKYTQ